MIHYISCRDKMKFAQPIEQIIRKRYSCRTFEQKPLDKKILRAIHGTLKGAIGPFGGKVKFQLVDTGAKDFPEKQKIGTYGMVKGARYFIVSIVDKEVGNLVDLGYLFEIIILKMTEMNLGTVWLGRAFNFNTFASAVKLKENETIPAVSPVGYIAERKRVVDSIISWGIKSRERKPWENLFFYEDFQTPLLEEQAGEVVMPLEMLRLAPSAKNQQPWRVLKQGEQFHFYLKTKDHYMVDTFSSLAFVDIGIALSHFDLTVNEMNIKGKLVKSDPQLESLPKNYNYIATWVKK